VDYIINKINADIATNFNKIANVSKQENTNNKYVIFVIFTKNAN